jgi:glycosyltransferase involved in cell wall biosynthesis
MAEISAPFVSVIIPVRNGERTIGDCVASVLHSHYPDSRREILVVDNASTDRTARIVQKYPVHWLQEHRLGPACARNRGIEASCGEILAFTDADCVVATAWLTELVKGFAGAAVWGVAGEIFSYPPQTPAERYMARRAIRQQDALRSPSWPYAVTANAAFRKATFARVGLFDAQLITGEDKDFGRRFFAAGLEMQYAPRAAAFHRHRTTTGAFFKQQVGYGYGGAALRAKYGMSWGVRGELAQYGLLLRALRGLARASVHWRVTEEARTRRLNAYFDALRCAARRLGALRWTLARRTPSVAVGVRRDALGAPTVEPE